MAPDSKNPEHVDVSNEEIESVGIDGVKDHHFTRRTFLSHLGAAGVAASASPLLAATTAHPTASASEDKTPESGRVSIVLNVNGQDRHLLVDPRTTLLDCLRENLDLPGTKKGCDHGQCGACTVHVNGRRVNSCLSFAAMHRGDRITTVEGLGSPEKLHPVQAAFVQFDAYQCGYCTSGQIMSAAAVIEHEHCGPTDDDVRNAMYGNICRCGAYPNIVAAVQHARKQA